MKNPKKAKATAATPGPVLVILSEDAMVAALNQYVEAKLELQKLQVIHEEAIAKANTDFDAGVQELRDRILALEGSVQLFCCRNKETLFAEPKSKDYANARVGFALNPMAVEKMLKGDTFDLIAKRLETVEWGEPYVTYKGPILDKKALLRDREILTPEQLATAGIKFEQEERFFIEVKATSVENVAKPADAVAAA